MISTNSSANKSVSTYVFAYVCHSVPNQDSTYFLGKIFYCALLQVFFIPTRIHNNSGITVSVILDIQRDIHVTTYDLQTLPPLAVGAQQPATIDPTLDLCTRYPSQLVGLR